MSLDRSKLHKLRGLGSGGWQAQCPACAEAGQDRKGEHLRISPEGKFGCCVFPGNREHRRRIFALAGEQGPKTIRVRVAQTNSAPAVQLDLLGRLGRVFENAERRMENGECKTGEPEGEIGTLGTGTYLLRIEENDLPIYIKDNREPVPSVPTVQQQQQLGTGVPTVPKKVRLPCLTESGDLVIPFHSPERYHWWTGGQSVRLTKQEVMERKENDAAAF